MRRFGVSSFVWLLSAMVLQVVPMAHSTAQSAEASRACVFTPDTENVDGAEKAWLPGSVRDKLEANLRTYTAFVLIDRANEGKIKSLQMSSEGAAYDEDTAIEVGRLTSANCALFSTIRWTGKAYTLGAGFTNLTTGERMATAASEARRDAASLFSGAGSAVDEVTITLCEQLGIALSVTQVYVLQHGDTTLSDADRLAMSQEEEEAFNKQIAELDRQIAEYAASSDLAASATRAKLETEKALAEERAKASADRAKRLQEESAQKAADARRDAERSIETRRERDALSSLVAQKADQARALKMEGQSVLERLLTIESKKRTLIEIRTSIKEREDELYDEAERQAKEKEAEISAREYRRAETTFDGKPTKKAAKARQKEIDKAWDDAYTAAQAAIDDMGGGVKMQDTLLTKEIDNDIKAASKRYTASSLTEDVKVSFTPFDGEAQGWDVDVYVYSGGEPLAMLSSAVKYADLLGFDGAKLPAQDKDYARYLDAVDIYDSLFARGDCVLTFEADYAPKPRSDNHPSQYTFTFSELRVIDTKSGKVIAKDTPSPHEMQKQFSPAYDMHSLEVIEHRERVRQAKNDYRSEYDWAYNTHGNGAMTGLQLGAGTKGFRFDGAFSILPWVFIGGYIGGNYKVPDEIHDIVKDKKYSGGANTMTLGGFVGANFSLFHIGPLHPVVYGTLGVGIANTFADDEFSTGETISLSYNTVFTQTAGIAIPVFHSAGGGVVTQVFAEVVRQDFKSLDTVNGLSFGIRVNFPTVAIWQP